MQYDFYNTDQFYKPSFTLKARDRLHRILFKGLHVRNVLEVGIGFGELASYCRRNEIGWAGVEANTHLAEAARQKGFPVYQAVMPGFPVLSEPVDTIFAAHFIEHLDDYHDALLFIEQSRDLLKQKKGKHLVLLYPDIEKIGSFFWQDYTHSFVTSKKRIEDMMTDTGFEIVKTGHYTACFFATSTLISLVGRVFPYFLLPKKIRLFARLSFQQHGYTIAKATS